MIEYPTKKNNLNSALPNEIQLRQHIHNYFNELQAAFNTVVQSEVAQVVSLLMDAGLKGKMIFICGNGGSASTASHMACDLAKGARVEGFPSFRAIALTDSLPQLTAWANDTSYDNCFSGQLEGLGQEGDLLIAISGSGNSPNVLKAVEAAKHLGMTTIGLAGFKGGKLKSLVDYCLVIPAATIEQVEDLHLVLEHTICTTLRYSLQERAAALASLIS